MPSDLLNGPGDTSRSGRGGTLTRRAYAVPARLASVAVSEWVSCYRGTAEGAHRSAVAVA